MTVKISSSEILLNAAQAELIARDGSLEMQTVAKRAAVSVGLAYHHFGSKAGLLAAVVDAFYAPLRDILLGDQIDKNQPWAKREQNRTNAMIDYYCDHPLAPVLTKRLGREPEVMDMENAHLDSLLELGARNIAQGQRMGVVRADLAPDTTVALLMGGINLAIKQALAKDVRPSRAALKNQIWAFIEGALFSASHQHSNTGGPNAGHQ